MNLSKKVQTVAQIGVVHNSSFKFTNSPSIATKNPNVTVPNSSNDKSADSPITPSPNCIQLHFDHSAAFTIPPSGPIQDKIHKIGCSETSNQITKVANKFMKL